MGRIRNNWSLPLLLLLLNGTLGGDSAEATASTGSVSRPSIASANNNINRGENPFSSEGILRSLESGVKATTRRLPSVLSRSSPALQAATRDYSNGNHDNNHVNSNNFQHPILKHGVVDASTLAEAMKFPKQMLSKLKARNPPNAGYFYGIQPHKIFPYRSAAKDEQVSTEVAMANTLQETLEEMRNMRKELQTLRREMYEMRKKITGEQDLDMGDTEEEEAVDPEIARMAKQKHQRKYDKMAKEIEDWARHMLFEEPREGNGWTEVACNKVVKSSYNPEGRTSCYLAWMKDSRGKRAFRDDDREYPCIKVYGTIDAPLEDVCTYLSREEHMTEYNDILNEHRDLEEIAPHSKITLATSPQVLFIKPREFVTFVHHKWLKDGSMVMVNQACEHKDAPAVTEEGRGKACRAYALRGATYLSPDPKDPGKTRMALISHAAPGGGIPQWATKTGVNAMTPLEPFKLVYRISDAVQKAKPEIAKLRMQRTEEVSVPGRSNQPVGMAQIGFAAFWPKGGGIKPPELDNNNRTAMDPPAPAMEGQANDDSSTASGTNSG